jgi:hypothetical protein
MRLFRSPLLGLALLSALPTIGSAQAGRLFKDSWFWGAKTGVMMYSTKAVENAISPMVGGEWLITRTRGALYVSYDQTFFNNDSAIQDVLNTNGIRIVNMDDMRRLTFAALAFPKQYIGFRPYGGVGVALNFIQTATPQGTYVSASQANDIAATVEDQRTRASVLLMLGLQAQYSRWSLFGQATMMPAHAQFLINGRSTYFVEGGLRYNIGSSIERIH